MIMMETNDYIILGYEMELSNTYSTLARKIESDNLAMVSAICYFKHIPIRGKHGDWSDKIYDIADKCHKMLYDYCIKKKYIDKSKSYDDYLNGALFEKYDRDF